MSAPDRNIFHKLAVDFAAGPSEIPRLVQNGQRFIVPSLMEMIDKENVESIKTPPNLPFETVCIHVETSVGDAILCVRTVDYGYECWLAERYRGQKSFHSFHARQGPIGFVNDGLSLWDPDRGHGRDSSHAFDILCRFLTLSSLCNVAFEDVAPPEALNRKRARGGKLPLYSYKVLTIDGERTSHGVAGSPTDIRLRSHYRRGHVRRLAPGRNVWVRPTFVQGGARGYVEKDYLVRAQG